MILEAALDAPLSTVVINGFPDKPIARESVSLLVDTTTLLLSVPAGAKMAVIQAGSDNNSTARINWSTDTSVVLDGTNGIRQTFGDLLYIYGKNALSAFQIIATVAGTIAEVAYY